MSLQQLPLRTLHPCLYQKTPPIPHSKELQLHLPKAPIAGSVLILPTTQPRSWTGGSWGFQLLRGGCALFTTASSWHSISFAHLAILTHDAEWWGYLMSIWVDFCMLDRYNAAKSCFYYFMALNRAAQELDDKRMKALREAEALVQREQEKFTQSSQRPSPQA